MNLLNVVLKWRLKVEVGKIFQPKNCTSDLYFGKEDNKVCGGSNEDDYFDQGDVPGFCLDQCFCIC